MENIPDQEIDPSLEATNLLSTEAQIRKIIQEQIIECLNRFYAIESGLWGKPINALILRTIFKGTSKTFLTICLHYQNVLTCLLQQHIEKFMN